MLAATDIQLVQEMVRELQARGEAARAQAIEAVLGLALAAAEEHPTEPRRFLTTGQAASVLGVSATTIRRWVASGRLAGTLQGGRVLIPREVIQRKLDRLLKATEPHPGHTSRTTAEQRMVAKTLQSELPQAKTARLATLHQQFADRGTLRPTELAELDALEREIARVAAQSLRDRIARSRPGSR